MERNSFSKLRHNQAYCMGTVFIYKCYTNYIQGIWKKLKIKSK